MLSEAASFFAPKGQPDFSPGRRPGKEFASVCPSPNGAAQSVQFSLVKPDFRVAPLGLLLWDLPITQRVALG